MIIFPAFQLNSFDPDSAANDFWGKTYLQLSGKAKIDQQLSILTGCTAGATGACFPALRTLPPLIYFTWQNLSSLSRLN